MSALRNASEVLRDAAWVELHPDERVRSARRRVLEAREAKRAAALAHDLAVADLQAAEADFDVRQAEAALLASADRSKPQ